MSTPAISRYISIPLLSITMLGLAPSVHAQTDTAQAEDSDSPPPRKTYNVGHQLAIGLDILYPALNTQVKNKYTYEGEVQYYLKNEFYAVAEGGWGGSKVTYPDLVYNTTNYFTRIGFNKSILYRESERDWDMMFAGFRAAFANVNRSAGQYVVADSLWGSISGNSPAKSFPVVWAEINLGMRLEMVRGLMAGWNLRGKFMMNGKSFRDLQPLHIAGYGRGDKSTVFDMNVYLDYAIRWNRHTKTEK